MTQKFGSKSTGEEVLQGKDLTGKTAVVTGAPFTGIMQPALRSACMCTEFYTCDLVITLSSGVSRNVYINRERR